MSDVSHNVVVVVGSQAETPATEIENMNGFEATLDAAGRPVCEVEDSESDWSTDSDEEIITKDKVRLLQQPDVAPIKDVPKTVHEVLVPENAVTKIEFQRVPETESIVRCGNLLSKVGTTFVVLGEANQSGKALDEGTIICLENRSVVGAIEEVFGPVVNPHYIVRFGCIVDDDNYDGPADLSGSKSSNSVKAPVLAAATTAAAAAAASEEDLVETVESAMITAETAACNKKHVLDELKNKEHLEKKNSDYARMIEDLKVAPGTPLFAVTGTIRYVVESKCRVKGSDASNLFNEEPTAPEDFSDDEEERQFKQVRKIMTRTGCTKEQAEQQLKDQAEQKRRNRPGNKRRNNGQSTSLPGDRRSSFPNRTSSGHAPTHSVGSNSRRSPWPPAPRHPHQPRHHHHHSERSHVDQGNTFPSQVVHLGHPFNAPRPGFSQPMPPYRPQPPPPPYPHTHRHHNSVVQVHGYHPGPTGGPAPPSGANAMYHHQHQQPQSHGIVPFGSRTSDHAFRNGAHHPPSAPRGPTGVLSEDPRLAFYGGVQSGPATGQFYPAPPDWQRQGFTAPQQVLPTESTRLSGYQNPQHVQAHPHPQPQQHQQHTPQQQQQQQQQPQQQPQTGADHSPYDPMNPW